LKFPSPWDNANCMLEGISSQKIMHVGYRQPIIEKAAWNPYATHFGKQFLHWNLTQRLWPTVMQRFVGFKGFYSSRKKRNVGSTNGWRQKAKGTVLWKMPFSWQLKVAQMLHSEYWRAGCEKSLLSTLTNSVAECQWGLIFIYPN